MDIRTKKTLFLESLDLPEVIHKAVSLAIDCIIENHMNCDDIPLVITSYDDSYRQQVLNATQKFCEATYPDTDKIYFDPCVLQINGRTSEEACINLIKLLRRAQGMLFWADTPSWFASLPDGLFHVVSIERNKATRGLNKKNAKPTIVTKEYSVDTLLPELFLNVTNMEQTYVTSIRDADMKFYNECHAGLIRPIPAPVSSSYDEEITIASPQWQKLACVALRRYQSNECHDGMRWDTTDDGWVDVVAYPFIEEIQSMDNSGRRQCLVGLVTINISNVNTPYLSTVWIHPFYRRKKLLSNLWQKLQQRYGSSFGIEQPNTNMKAFLKSVKHADY
ncbi:GNAT family N-acetyltransferase [Aeromonas salmonicida]